MHPLRIKVVKDSPLGQSWFQCVASVVYKNSCSPNEILDQIVAVYMRLLKVDNDYPLLEQFTTNCCQTILDSKVITV